MIANLLLCGAPAEAKEIAKTVRPGERVLMYRYANWQRDCSADLGDVKLLAKPQHGKLATQRETGPIPAFGTRMPSPPECTGRPTPMFAVYHTSDPGFRGIDTFKIEVNYRRHQQEIDSFTVNVR